MAWFGADPGDTLSGQCAPMCAMHSQGCDFVLYICLIFVFILHFALYYTIYLSHISSWQILLVSCDNKCDNKWSLIFRLLARKKVWLMNLCGVFLLSSCYVYSKTRKVWYGSHPHLKDVAFYYRWYTVPLICMHVVYFYWITSLNSYYVTIIRHLICSSSKTCSVKLRSILLYWALPTWILNAINGSLPLFFKSSAP